MRFSWIASNKMLWPVSMACELLGVSTSGYFEHWRRKGANKPSKADTNKRIGNEALLAHIRAIHAEVKQEYGWPKMWKELVGAGYSNADKPSSRSLGTSRQTTGWTAAT